MYSYADERSYIFTEDGQEMFLAIRDNTHALIAKAGAVKMDKAMCAGVSGSSWHMLACIDRLVELGEIREVTRSGCAGQDRVFVGARHG